MSSKSGFPRGEKLQRNIAFLFLLHNWHIASDNMWKIKTGKRNTWCPGYSIYTPKHDRAIKWKYPPWKCHTTIFYSSCPWNIGNFWPKEKPVPKLFLKYSYKGKFIQAHNLPTSCKSDQQDITKPMTGCPTVNKSFSMMMKSLTATLDTQSNATCRGGVMETSALTLYGSPGL